MRNILTQTLSVCAASCALVFVTGCETQPTTSASSTTATQQSAVVAAQPATTTPPAVATPAPQAQTIVRVNAGASAPFTDPTGAVWQADTGFEGGDVIERDLTIANTTNQKLFLSEHYSMESFSAKVPNGKYVAKLYFAETYEGIGGPGERVFSFNVQGQREFKDFDVWVKAGGANKAYVETVPVEVTNGTFKITFTPNVENPQINAIELIPQ